MEIPKKYESSSPVNLTVEQTVRMFQKMYPEMTKEEITEKLTNGEGLEFDMGYAVKRIKEIMSRDPRRN